MGDTITKVKILTQYEGMSNSRSLSTYKEHGGYEALAVALKKSPDEIVSIVKDSGLRGRGGAGFPTGLKWSFVPKTEGKKYLLCNNDEGEPGTFKDRYILELSPHMLIEGMIISAFAVGAQKGYVYTRCEFFDEIKWLDDAIKEAYEAGYLGKNILGLGFDFDLDQYQGAGAYICGEETGLISSLEGKKGQPKLKPPFPAVSGYLGCPTVVNNTETLSAVPWIVKNGSDAYRAIGTEKSPGTKLFSISGPLKNPGVFEVPLGYPMMKLVEEDAGGLLEGEELKAIIPGGLSAPVLLPEDVKDLTLDYEAIAASKSMLGSGAITIIPKRQCMVELLKLIMDFYHHESCGQCTPCREGTGWITNILEGFFDKSATVDDIDQIYAICQQMAGRTICALSDAAMPTVGIINKFRDELVSYIERGTERERFSYI
ncbi:MAG: NADH-quinone oxidoreductase subunit NuoF [Bdellovibrionota bacterium]